MVIRSIARTIAVLSLVLIVLLMTGGLTAGQGDNLLTNPGFEDPFANQGGEPERQVATGWIAWHIPAAPGAPLFQNQQPGYLPTSPDTTRIRTDGNSQLITAFFATFTGGVYQEVSGVTPGDELQFSTYAYVWSSTFDDPAVSENDGGVVVQVGIDPNGGNDPTSDEIIWSPASQRYDEWFQYTVNATAEAPTVSVWIRAVVSAPTKNNNVYLDDASLTVVSASAPEATSTDVAPTEATEVAAPIEVTPDVGAPIEVTPDVAVPTEATTDTGISPTATQEQLLSAATAVPLSTPTPIATVDPAVFQNTIVHVVQPGDSVYRIAQLYGSTVNAIISANGLNPNALIFVGQRLLVPVRLPPVEPVTSVPPTGVPPTATPTTPAPQTTYVIQPGDTLSGIARRFNTTVGTLAQLNGIVNPDRILWGQRLILPTPADTPPTAVPPTPAQPTATPVSTTPATYVVQPGDTLFRISARYGVPLSQLIQLNAIRDPNLIFVGQTLVLR